MAAREGIFRHVDTHAAKVNLQDARAAKKQDCVLVLSAEISQRVMHPWCREIGAMP
eukprot:CAMPEP_0172753288 /NCGR_PEP_ID=MMETSP1074-20121228/155666_1 /TAXON_ID=2916 /ORGANISM="Ceratium fusus, Strain PA161109" /LENGTH=55 /DNA_ID=CAMNT_0013585931 /DNA_START=66 /DNA_END=233 /DNA_ORIENTATION=-